MGQTAPCASTGCDGTCQISAPSDEQSDTVKVDVALLNAVVSSANRTPRQHPLKIQQRFVQGADATDEDIDATRDDAFEECADGPSFHEKEDTWVEDVIEQSRCGEPVTAEASASRTNSANVCTASSGSVQAGSHKSIETPDSHHSTATRARSNDTPDDVQSEECEETDAGSIPCETRFRHPHC